ncbi:hypothetical protein [Chryseobacterium sp.]|jgi:chromosomal replication initiation ATPase DnaA|uniref:hypothetical protein n=1 Tax=Chryseobacterium sp. TaxID=1871047 RepID=UPI0028460019|nr:hypothetical protein [Chryseobacterium sp.]MDR3022755.1 hypothetical protein [Chryseobacterium sp.]
MKFTEQEKIIEQILKAVELQTGINRSDFVSNSRKESYLDARKKATELLIKEAHLNDEGIAKVLGVSKSTANIYRNSLRYQHKK